MPLKFATALDLHQAGRLAEAEVLYRQILAVQPHHAQALHYLGLIAYQVGRCDQAIGLIHQALAINPSDHSAHYHLGGVYLKAGRPREAITSYRRALELNPDHPDTYNNLAIALSANSEYEEATATYRRVTQLRPDYPLAYYNLGSSLAEGCCFDEAVVAYRRALELKPDWPEAHLNLGNALKERGELLEAMAAYRRAVQLRPEYWEAQSNLIYTLHFHPEQDGGTIIEEQRRWNRQFVQPLKLTRPQHANDRNPRRRLRIGYVSSHFTGQVVGRNLIPLFRHHDHGKFEVICYSGIKRPDKFSEEFRRCADHWRNVWGVTDEALAAIILQDGIDILVDLSQHMGNRLPVFARQPAPVQVSFAGYPETAGVETIPYRISDRYLEARIRSAAAKAGGDVPPAQEVVLIDSFWCYDPLGSELAENELPANKNGYVTFGCLNNICKVNEAVLSLWARILNQIPTSRLILLAPVGSARERVRAMLLSHGVEATRIEFVAREQQENYLRQYHRVDIVLDPFPYNGHTTSLDALWMGLPVVTLCGSQAVARGGWSQMATLEMEELVAASEEDYFKIAADLAGNLPRLAELRRTLRGRMQASPLMDAKRFAESIESAYRVMWQRWCAHQQSLTQLRKSLASHFGKQSSA